MFYWIYDLPTWKLVAWFAIFFVGFAWVGVLFFRPFLQPFVRSQSGRNEFVGYILSSYCVFYGLLLGLVAVAAYQNFADVEATVGQESSSLAALYRDVSSYPEPIRRAMQSILREYVRYLVEESWPAQQRGEVALGGNLHMSALQEILRTFEPQTKGEEILHSETYGQFNNYVQLRSRRLQSVTTGIPSILWYVVIIGAFLTILLVWLFDIRLVPQLFLGGVLAFFVATMISLTAAMDNPYRGEFSVSSQTFQEVFLQLMASGDESVLAPRQAEHVALKGVGATLPALFRVWFDGFTAEYPQISVDYDAVGGGKGVQEFLAGNVDFAASVKALTDEEVEHLERGVQHIPVAAGMLALAYNLPGITGLRLSREAYPAIFLGQITRWDDPVIAACNPRVPLPDKEINLVARLGASGTTHILANHLTAISGPWSEKNGATDLVAWPDNVLKHESNEQIAKAVQATPGAIGYVDLAAALHAGLSVARLENQAGRYVQPRYASGTLALQQYDSTDGDLRIAVPDPTASDGYPLVGYLWLLVYERYDKPQTTTAIKQLIRWCLLAGQNDCERLGYVKLPPNIVSRSIYALEEVRSDPPRHAVSEAP